MLAVARALMIDPELILMDEPSEGLAPVMVQNLEDIILELKGPDSASCWSSRTSTAPLRSLTGFTCWRRAEWSSRPEPPKSRPIPIA